MFCEGSLCSVMYLSVVLCASLLCKTLLLSIVHYNLGIVPLVVM